MPLGTTSVIMNRDVAHPGLSGKSMEDGGKVVKSELLQGLQLYVRTAGGF